jgi:hypothetical protein
VSATSHVCKGRVLKAGTTVDHALTLQNLTVVPVRVSFESICRTAALLSYDEDPWCDHEDVASGKEPADCTAEFSSKLHVGAGASSRATAQVVVKTRVRRLPDGPVETSVVLRHGLTVT